MTTGTKVSPDPRTTTTLAHADAGRRLAELEQQIARATRNLARLGWTQEALDELTADAPRMQCGSSPRMKAVAR